VSESIWKKEISFRRKAKPEQPEPDAPPAELAAPEAKGSIWKKEITLGRKPKQPEPSQPAPVEPVHLAAAPAPEPEPEPEPAELPQAAGEYEWQRPAASSTPPNLVAVASPAAVHGLPGAEPPAPAAAPEPLEDAEPEQPPKAKRRRRRRGEDDAEGEERPARGPKASRGPRRARGKQLVGLKVGASQLAAARVANDGTAELLQVARAELEPGLVVAGELRDPDALAEALRTFFRRHKLPRRGVRLGIANNRVGVRTFDIAGITDSKQLANAIRFRAQEALPIPIEEAVLDYRVLAEGTTEEGEPLRRILLVVAYRDLVDRYVAACRKAGITLSGIDLEAFALLRSLSAPRDDLSETDAALVAVAVGHERSTFAVSDGRVCEFTRVLDWGGSTLDVAVARALDITPPEAGPIKRELSLHAPTTPEGLTPEQAQAATDAVRRQVHAFARELVSSLQFYQNQPGSLGIGEIVITGGTAHLPGFAEELQGLIGVTVRVGDPLARVRVNKKVHEQDQVGSLAVAIGLGIED
jgi:type IV pilus assembly protein PilM